MYPQISTTIHSVPTLIQLIDLVIFLKDTKNLRQCEQLMYHLFTAVKPNEYQIIYHNGNAVAKMGIHTYMMQQFTRHGVYECLLNS